MNEKKVVLVVGGVSLAVALGLGWFVYAQYETIALAREEVGALRVGIDQSRKLLAQTPMLEKEVIVMRETEEAIKEILPDEQDLNNLVRDLQRFQDDTNVHITGLKKRDLAPKGAKADKDAFDKVGYEITLEADSFQLLSFLDRIESHSRFLRVPSVTIDAAARRDLEKSGVPEHKVKLEVETFMYRPQVGLEQIKIDSYPRKRELLLGEIARHRQAISVDHYSYRGQRGRRDPFVDPRMPVAQQDPSGLSIQEQSRIVDELVERMNELRQLSDAVSKPGITIVEQMTTRAEIEQKLAALEEAARAVAAEGKVRFPMAESRLQQQVLEPMTQMRNELLASAGSSGPTAETLTQLLQTMIKDLDQGEPKLALEAFATIEPSLGLAQADSLRKGLADSLRRKADEARIQIDFDSKTLDIKGVAIQEGRAAVALINGRALSAGDLVDDELVVRAIRPGEIEFVFRGVVLVRRY